MSSNLTFSKLWDSACRVAGVQPCADSVHRHAAKNALILASMLDGERVLIANDTQFEAVVKTVRKHAEAERQSATVAEAKLSASSISWTPAESSSSGSTSASSSAPDKFDPRPAKAGDKCIRCSAATKVVLLAGGDRAAYCSLDRVTTPIA